MDWIIAAILCPTAHRLHRPADNCRHRACVRIMEPLQLLIVASAYFFAAFVKGITGLGFSTTALPFLVLALGLKTTLPLLIIPSVVSNLIVMHGAGHFRSSLRQFWLLYASALPGLVVGLSLLATLDPGHSTAVLGAVLIVYLHFCACPPRLSSCHASGPAAISADRFDERHRQWSHGLAGDAGAAVLDVSPSGTRPLCPSGQHFFHRIELGHGRRSCHDGTDDPGSGRRFAGGSCARFFRHQGWHDRAAVAVTSEVPHRGPPGAGAARSHADHSSSVVLDLTRIGYHDLTFPRSSDAVVFTQH